MMQIDEIIVTKVEDEYHFVCEYIKRIDNRHVIKKSSKWRILLF